jgi:hypothetical protein
MQVQGSPMTPSIEVQRVNAGEFRVRVSEGRGETSHLVTLPLDYYQRLAGGKAQPEELVKHSFEFLLEREPKESILARFELPAIARYFPEYEREIQRRL